MKKTGILLGVLVLLLVVAPWGIGRIAEKRVNAGLDRLVEEAPYLSIVERNWTSGWFRSEQTVTFEVMGPWLKAMNPATVLDAIESEDEQSPAEDPTDLTAQAEAEAEVGAEDPTGAEGAGPADPQAAPASPATIPPLRFIVKNEVLHGPVLWPASFGLARVNSKLVLGEEVKQELIRTIGTDEPVRISTRVGFFGGGNTTFSGKGQTIKFEDGTGTLTYDDFELDLGYSGNLDDFDVKGELPRLAGNDTDESSHFEMTGISLVGDSERVKGDVYDADFRFAIDKIVAVDAMKQETTIEGVHYLVKSASQDDFMDVSAKLGTGKAKHPFLAEQQLELDEIHYDVTLRRLHIDTLVNLMADIKAMYTKPVATVADVDALIMKPVETHGLALLRHDPEFVIDRIGIVTSDGEGVIKGVVRLKGLEEADLAQGPMALLDKFEADVTIECAQKLIEKFPNGGAGAGVMLDQGFARREGEKLVSRIEYKRGELKINGKPQGLPGLEGPPGDDEPMRGE